MKTVSRIVPIALRIALGLVFTGAGITGLLQLAGPPALSGAAGAFMGGLAAAGYLFPLLKSVELGAGLLLLSGRMVPFALTLLAPIIINIAAFHVLLAPQGAAMAAFVLLAEIALAWMYRDAFAPLFRRTSSPSRSEEPQSIAADLDSQASRA
jgi:putative oxidoreductase